MKTFASVTETPCTCRFLENRSRDPDWPIEFDARLNEYHIVTNGAFGRGQGMIYHCPWCGGEAPRSSHQQLFATVSSSEDFRLREMVRAYRSYDDAKYALGPPDWEPFPGTTVTKPASDVYKPIAEAFREAHYKNLSGVADLVLVDYPNRQMGVRVAAKYIGLPGEKPMGPKTLRALPSGMDPAVESEIDARLDALEREHNVKILLAVESGSRAWGFPSPDSDYDCRFVYVRAPQDYMTLFPKRDVIETPLTDVFDVNGWDLAKALKLLLAGNAVIIEWLTSPIIYRADAGFRNAFLDLAGIAADRNRIARHYLHLGRSIYESRLGDLDDIPLKKLFYALRPAIALRWMRLNPDARLPPMNFPGLCQGADLPGELQGVIDDMLARKAVTRELGRGPMPQMIRDAILLEFATADEVFARGTPHLADDTQRIDDFFRTCVARYAPAG